MAAAEVLEGRAMASAVRIVVVGGRPAAAAGAMDLLHERERTWTRFSPDSDISRLNRDGGAHVRVASSTLVLVAAMVEGWRLTGGRFDPSTLPALVAHGYGTSIVDPARTTSLPDGAASGADLALVELDVDASTVRLPAGCALDPGGVGKGLAADLSVERLLADGAEGALVSVGGDLAVAGRPPTGDRWRIAVEVPDAPGVALRTIELDRGGVATSSTRSRRIGPDGRDHHLIDPATGRPAATDIAAATVVASTAWRAEALATSVLIGGSEDAVDHLVGQGVDGLVVRCDGVVASTPALEPVPAGVRS